MKASDILSIGTVARRVGMAVSAIRFYEQKGLVHPLRLASGQRRFLRSDIRRLSFIMIAQRLGFSLNEIKAQLDKLPAGRTPTRQDWQIISRDFRADLDARISQLLGLRDRLDGCIGCGCLSLEHCALYNADDHVGTRGPGAVLLAPSAPPGGEIPTSS